MTMATTQSDFRDNLKQYVDDILYDHEKVYIPKGKGRGIAVVDQDYINWLEKHATADPDSLEYAIAEDKLIEAGLLPDNSKEVSDFDKYLKDLENEKI